MKFIPPRIQQFLARGSFGRNVALVAGGTAFTQALIILSTPLLTRLYSPSDFGTFGVYASIISVLAVIAALRFEVAIPLPEEEESAIGLLALSVLTAFAISTVLGLIIMVAGEQLVQLTKTKAIQSYLWIIPISLLAVGIFQSLSYWAIRHKGFSQIAKTKINQGWVGILTQVGLGFSNLGPLGLLVGDLLGKTSGVTTLARFVHAGNRSLLRSVTLPLIWQTAKRYKGFAAVSSTSSLLNAGTNHLPVMLTAILYDPVTAGYFALATRLIRTPSALVGAAVSQVFYGEASRLAKEDPSKLSYLLVQTTKKLIALAIVPTLLLCLFAKPVVPLIFGAPWSAVGSYIQLLSFLMASQFVVSSISQIVYVTENQNKQLLGDAVCLAALVVLCIFCYAYHWPAESFVLAYSLLMSTYFILFYGFYWQSAKRLERRQVVNA